MVSELCGVYGIYNKHCYQLKVNRFCKLSNSTHNPRQWHSPDFNTHAFLNLCAIALIEHRTKKEKHEKHTFLFSLQQLEEFGIYENIPTGITAVFS